MIHRLSPDRMAMGALVALLCLVPTVPAAAQFRPVEGREYREFRNPVNPVRGEAVVGLSIVPDDGAPRSRTVEVWLPVPFVNGELQVETLTADGRFRGEGAFRGSTSGRQWVSLALTPTPRPGDPFTLALAIRGPGSNLLVARWGSTPAGSATSIRFYVNSRRADIFLRAGVTLVRCLPVKISQPLRFDTYCDVPASAVPPDGQVTLTRRDQFDEQSQMLTVKVP